MAYCCKVVRNIPWVIPRPLFLKPFSVFSRRESKGNRYLQASFSSTQVETSDDTPIKFSTSGAGQWRASYTRRGTKADEVPEIQSYAVVASLAAFLIYFCILREENDLDDFLREAETKVPPQLIKAVEHAASDPKANDRPEIAIYLRRLREMEAKQKELEGK